MSIINSRPGGLPNAIGPEGVPGAAQQGRGGAVRSPAPPGKFASVLRREGTHAGEVNLSSRPSVSSRHNDQSHPNLNSIAEQDGLSRGDGLQSSDQLSKKTKASEEEGNELIVSEGEVTVSAEMEGEIPIPLELSDPMLRVLSGVAPPTTGETRQKDLPDQVLNEIQNLMNQMVRRAAWGGDRRKGSARIELGSGVLEGATLTVHAENREVSIELELPPGAATADLRERIVSRLESRGLSVRSFELK